MPKIPPYMISRWGGLYNIQETGPLTCIVYPGGGAYIQYYPGDRALDLHCVSVQLDINIWITPVPMIQDIFRTVWHSLGRHDSDYFGTVHLPHVNTHVFPHVQCVHLTFTYVLISHVHVNRCGIATYAPYLRTSLSHTWIYVCIATYAPYLRTSLSSHT